MGGTTKIAAPPAAPDPAETIAAQTRATQVSQFTPTGNLRFGTVGEGGQFQADDPNIPIDINVPRALQVQETAFQDQLRGGAEDLALGFLPQFSGQLDPFTISAGDIQQQVGDAPLTGAQDIAAGLTPLVTDLAGQGEQLEQATFERGKALLEPRFEEERGRLEQRLVDQGLPRGGEAFTRELNRLQQGQGEQLTKLSLDAVSAGRQEQSRLQALSQNLRGQQFQEGVGLAGLTSQQRAQAIQEQTGLSALERQIRAQQFGEVGSIGGFATPFTQISAPGVDAAGIINQGFQNQLASKQFQQDARATRSGFFGDIITAGASAGGAAAASDERLKENIKPLGKENGHNIYEFTYKGKVGKYIGVMAQEVEKIMPAAVTMKDGFKAVYYDMIGVRFRHG